MTNIKKITPLCVVLRPAKINSRTYFLMTSVCQSPSRDSVLTRCFKYMWIFLELNVLPGTVQWPDTYGNSEYNAVTPLEYKFLSLIFIIFAYY